VDLSKDNSSMDQSHQNINIFSAICHPSLDDLTPFCLVVVISNKYLIKTFQGLDTVKTLHSSFKYLIVLQKVREHQSLFQPPPKTCLQSVTVRSVKPLF
jgi:hypothetical protein